METTAKRSVRREGDDIPSTSDGKNASYDHPVFKKLSAKNGEINRMTKEEIKKKLEKLNLDTRGVKEVLKKRLKSFYKRRKLAAAHVSQSKAGPQYDYYMVIDFEATCQEHNPDEYKHEIIEFPVVLIDSHQKKVVGEFHSYVKPKVNAQLTPFCTELTGIKQSTVDQAESFPEVLERVEEWMKSRNLHRKGSCAVITDGPWDMSRFMFIQCQLSRHRFPRWARKWVNIRKTYCNFYQFRKAKIVTMLENLGMCFEGHQHSGIDDARNITRVVIRLLEDGSEMRVNERIYEEKLRLVQELAVEAENNAAVACRSRSIVQCEIQAVSGNDRNSDIDSDEDLKEKEVENQDANDEYSALASVQESMENMNIHNNHTDTINSEEDESDDFDDLLSYYALQKS